MPESKDKGDPGAADQDKTVPIERLNDQIAKTRKVETELAELRGEVKALKEKPVETKQDEPKDFTRAELAAAVTQGKVSQAEADSIWEKQLRASVKKEAKAEIRDEVTQESTKQKTLAEIGRFQEALPDLKDKSSEGFGKVKAKFERLVSLGSPPTLATELAAIEAVYGDVDKLKKGGKAERETHQETGGDYGGRDGGEPSGKLKDLTPREREYYGRKIDSGEIKGGWDAVRKLLKDYGNPELRNKRAGEVYRRRAG